MEVPDEIRRGLHPHSRGRAPLIHPSPSLFRFVPHPTPPARRRPQSSTHRRRPPQFKCLWWRHCHGAASASAPSSTTMQQRRKGGVRIHAMLQGQLLAPETLARGHGDRPSSGSAGGSAPSPPRASINKVQAV